jgi:hypothetical protein
MFRLFPNVGAAAVAAASVAVGVFWSLGCRSSVFGASSLRTRLFGGFSGSFRTLISGISFVFWLLFAFPLFFGFTL